MKNSQTVLVIKHVESTSMSTHQTVKFSVLWTINEKVFLFITSGPRKSLKEINLKGGNGQYWKEDMSYIHCKMITWLICWSYSACYSKLKPYFPFLFSPSIYRFWQFSFLQQVFPSDIHSKIAAAFQSSQLIKKLQKI